MKKSKSAAKPATVKSKASVKERKDSQKIVEVSSKDSVICGMPSSGILHPNHTGVYPVYSGSELRLRFEEKAIKAVQDNREAERIKEWKEKKRMILCAKKKYSKIFPGIIYNEKKDVFELFGYELKLMDYGRLSIDGMWVSSLASFGGFLTIKKSQEEQRETERRTTKALELKQEKKRNWFQRIFGYGG